MRECAINGWTLRGATLGIEVVSPSGELRTVEGIRDGRTREDIIRDVEAVAGEDLITAGEFDPGCLIRLRGMGIPPPDPAS